MTTAPTPIKHHWIMTVQTATGTTATTDSVVDVTPGSHTHEFVYSEVLKAVRQWIGTDDVTVLFFSVTPNQL